MSSEQIFNTLDVIFLSFQTHHIMNKPNTIQKTICESDDLK